MRTTKLDFSYGLVPMDLVPRDIESPPMLPLSDEAISFLSGFRKTGSHDPFKLFLELEWHHVNGNVLADALYRIAGLEARRLGSGASRNQRRRLADTLKLVRDTERALEYSRRGRLNLHSSTTRELRRSASWIEADLKDWERPAKGRGAEPQTAIIVCLAEYVRVTTRRHHYRELAALVSEAYAVAGSGRRCTIGRLKRLWGRHLEIRGKWTAVLRGLPPPKSRKRNLLAAWLAHIVKLKPYSSTVRGKGHPLSVPRSSFQGSTNEFPAIPGRPGLTPLQIDTIAQPGGKPVTSASFFGSQALHRGGTDGST